LTARALVQERPERLVAAILIAVYAATLAPDVTFWDAGEFIAAAETFGIPHPPGTPLYVFVLAAFSRLTPFLPTAVATNLVSALCTAFACAIIARLLRRWTGDPLIALAGGIAPGVMTTIWLNATETEVYAASLALAAGAMWAADHAGRTGRVRWLVLVAYCFVLAVPTHLSMLVAGPAIAWLAWSRDDGGVRWGDALLLGAAWLGAMGLGRMSLVVPAIAFGVLLVGVVVRARIDHMGWRRSAGAGLSIVAVGVVAATALLAMWMRARHDPAINQGGAFTFAELSDAVARRQYAVPGLWPRGAPLWIQIGNVFEYADWQAALSLGRTVYPTVSRVLATIAWAALGVFGCLAHRRLHRRSWRALLILLVAGSLGVVLYLNMRASPSFGHGILPANAIREARERDYFFVFAFLPWGVWSGLGAVALARRFGWHGWAGVAIACAPMILNWSAVDRSRGIEAELARVWATEVLTSAPPRAVLFVSGDIDTYPMWYAQEVLGIRRDVTLVTTPLLPAEWYRDEMSRRHGIYADSSARPWRGRNDAIAMMATRVRAGGRPVVASVSLPAGERRQLGARWELRGLVYAEVLDDDGAVADSSLVTIDSAATRAVANRVAAWRRGRRPAPAIDQIAQYALGLLECPSLALRAGTDARARSSLDSTCNLR
jgi:hypothetical protein